MCRLWEGFGVMVLMGVLMLLSPCRCLCVEGEGGGMLFPGVFLLRVCGEGLILSECVSCVCWFFKEVTR